VSAPTLHPAAVADAHEGYRLADLDAAEQAFLAACPGFDAAGTFPALRRQEYGRLDAVGHVYLDYTGGGLYAASQVEAHAQLLHASVLGNPHSDNPTSRASTELVERTRRAVLRHFNADPDEYRCIFTANASAALKLVGESFRFEPGGTFALTFDNHNSVNGIREFAGRRGANVVYVPIRAPELRLDLEAMRRVLRQADPSRANLLAFPAQSNFSGVQHPLELVTEAQAAGWHVVLDTAAFVPTNRLDLSRVRPDFACVSFYKMFGYPTGAGCLLVRRDAAAALVRPWFAGGTVTVASVQGGGHYLHDGEAGFEDGTVDYANLPAVEIGLRHLERLGIDRIHARVTALTWWLLDTFATLRHANGRPVVEVLGPTDIAERGGTVAFELHDRDGRAIPLGVIERLASRENISLRTGCFCNPGAGEVAHHLGARELAAWFDRDEPVTFDELQDGLRREHDVQVGAVRVSLGAASSFADVYRFMGFVVRFVDRTVGDVQRLRPSTPTSMPSTPTSMPCMPAVGPRSLG
jgi:selenocysteine lyase/cysteine desulfurase